MARIIITIIVAGLMLSSSAPMQSFADVPPDYWAYSEIEAIYEAGLVIGCWNTPGLKLYCPERAPTRAEVAVMLARLLEIIEATDKCGVVHEEKQEQPQKPGKLVPNPGLPEWEL